MKKKIFVLLALLLSASYSVFGQDGTSVAMPFLAIDRSAATGAMGGARITDGMFNPAAVPFTGSDIQLSYQLWSPGTAKASHINVLSGVKIGKSLGVSVHGAYQAGEPYSLFDASGKAGDSFRPSDLLLGIGAGYAFTSFLSAGINLNFARQTLSPSSAYSAFAADVFLMYKYKGLKAAAGVANLGTPVKSGDYSFPIPSSAKLGASYTLPFGLGFAADFDYYFAGGVGVAAGAQYAWNDMIFARAGYHFESGKSPLPSYASVGLGAKFYGVHLDVSYFLASASLANTLTIGLGYSF